jgi:preprotein translocase subunit SecG
VEEIFAILIGVFAVLSMVMGVLNVSRREHERG